MPIKFQDHNPETLEQAVNILFYSLSPKEESIVFEAENHYEFHHTIGRQMRNEWKLWDKNSTLYNFFKDTYDITHADDMSGLILGCLVARVQNKQFDVDAQVQKYKNHWSKQ